MDDVDKGRKIASVINRWRQHVAEMRKKGVYTIAVKDEMNRILNEVALEIERILKPRQVSAFPEPSGTGGGKSPRRFDD